MGASLRVQKPLAAEKGTGPGAMSGAGNSDTLGGDKLQDGFAGADPLQDTLQVAAPANNPDMNAAPGQSGKAKLEHQEPNKDKDAQADKEESNQPADGESAARAQGGPGGVPGDAPAPGAGPTGGGGAPDPKGAGPPEDGPADKSKGAEAAKKEQAGASPGAAGGGGAPAPASPEDDPAFQQVKAAVEAAGEAQQEHPTGEAAASDAQGAAVGPPNEGASQAAAAQTEKMDAQEPGTFDKKAFKDAVAARIESLTPQNLDGLDKFKESGGVGQVKADVTGQVTASKDAAAQGIEKTTTEEPDPSKAHPKEVTPLEVTEAGAAPQISAAGAAPKPRPASDLSLEQGPQELDAMMSEADVTEEQLLNSNEPDFVASVDAKKAAEADSATQPGLARADEAAAIQAAQAGAQGDADQQLAAMNQARAAALGQVEATQGDTKTEDETARAEVATQIEKIYNDTKSAVETRLKKLDEDVDSTFDAGAKSAQAAFEAEVEAKMDAWKAERYAGIDGKARWVADLFRDLPPEVNQFYSQARNNYVTAMNGVIDEVASVVETGLNEAKQLIAEGRQKVADYVKGLPETLKGVGAEAASEIEGRFAELDQTVENKQGELVDHLAQRYTESLKTIDTRIEEMKEANKGWISQAKDKVTGTLETIRGLKDMLLGVLSRGANAIGLILKDPIGFLGNLVSGVGAGLKGFLGNIGEHMKKGLMDWLFGAVAEAGLTLPDNFDLKGILDLVMQVLGLTKDAFRARAVELLGEPVVNAIETGVEIFKIVMTQGVVGLWSYIKDRLGDLKEMVLGAIREWVTGKIITAGITWILGLLNPAGAFIKACKAIYDIIMFFVERGSQILSLVNAVIDSVTAIAQGSTGAAAKAIEGALAKALPVAIGFLASLLGVTGISKFIRGAIDKVREPVSKAIDWVIKKAKDLAGAILEKLGIKKGEEKKAEDEGDVILPEGKIGTEEAFSSGGEQHGLWMELHAGDLQIMVASTPATAIAKLGETHAKLVKIMADIGDKPSVEQKRDIETAKETMRRLTDMLSTSDGASDATLEKLKVDLQGEATEAVAKAVKSRLEIAAKPHQLSSLFMQLFEAMYHLEHDASSRSPLGGAKYLHGEMYPTFGPKEMSVPGIPKKQSLSTTYSADSNVNDPQHRVVFGGSAGNEAEAVRKRQERIDETPLADTFKQTSRKSYKRPNCAEVESTLLLHEQAPGTNVEVEGVAFYGDQGDFTTKGACDNCVEIPNRTSPHPDEG